MQQLQLGTILQGGKYRIERVLGQGGFGNTYIGYNTEFEETVAIKEFFMKGVTERDESTWTISVSNNENQSQFEEQREKFKKEARRIRKLNNSHIVKVHDLFEENGTAYYVMDYVEGHNLAEIIKNRGRAMSEQEVLKILPQILDALKSVHDVGIWHLDLKPANIMIDKDGNVKLIDFGASKQLNTQKGGATTSTAISYTNGYAPREQMEQNYDKFGPWTDFYALGASLYNILTTNRPPMPSDIDDEGEAAFSFSSTISAQMKKLILKLMTPNRNNRPKSVEEIQSLLEKYEISSDDPNIKDSNEETMLLVSKENKQETVGNNQNKEQVTSEETILDVNKNHSKNRQNGNFIKSGVENVTNPSKQKISVNTDSSTSSKANKDLQESANNDNNGHDLWFIFLFVIIVLLVGGFFIIYSNKNEDVSAEQLRTDSVAILRPKYIVGDSVNLLAIRKITLTPNQTKIDFFGVNDGYEWITIKKDAYISGNNIKYVLKEAIGIEVDPQKTYFNEADEAYSFSLIFPPIPIDVKEFDFVESDDSKWKFYNIDIDPEHYKERDETVQKIISNMVEVKGGSFIMGDDGWVCSTPKHKVELSDYYIGKYEVTQKEWEIIYGENPSNNKGSEKPVECVNWNICLGFAYVLSELSGRLFRLPTEAEWEYAARGGNKSKKYKYSGSNKLDAVAWYADNSNETHPVGQKEPNELGLYDMSGNVWEWCSDYYDNYSSKTQIDPKGPKEGKARVYRGGSYYDKETLNKEGYSDFWVFARTSDEQEKQYTNIGFRLVMEK